MTETREAAASLSGIERLERGLAVLRQVKPGRLDMTEWYDLEVDAKHAHYYDRDTLAPHCGTVACALGWMSLDPVLQAEGLVPSEFGCIPRYRSHTGIIAAEQFFNCTHQQARRMFMPPDGDGRTDEQLRADFFDIDAACARIEAVLAELKAVERTIAEKCGYVGCSFCDPEEGP